MVKPVSTWSPQNGRKESREILVTMLEPLNKALLYILCYCLDWSKLEIQNGSTKSNAEKRSYGMKMKKK